MEEIRDPKLNSDFERFEAQLRVTKYKFGVLYCAEGQVEENDMYSNGMIIKTTIILINNN